MVPRCDVREGEGEFGGCGREGLKRRSEARVVWAGNAGQSRRMAPEYVILGIAVALDRAAVAVAEGFRRRVGRNEGAAVAARFAGERGLERVTSRGN